MGTLGFPGKHHTLIGWISQVFCWLPPGFPRGISSPSWNLDRSNAGTARGTRTSRRQRSWNELKLPLPWEGEKFSGQRGARSWKDGLFSFRGGRCDFYCLKNFRWYYGFFPNKTQGKSQNFLKKLQAGKFATKTSFTLDDWRKKTVEVILVASASAVLGRILVELFVGRGMLSTVRAGNVSFDKP